MNIITVFKKNILLLVTVLVICTLIALTVYAISIISNLRIDFLTRDPGQASGIPLLGILSNFGIMVWAAATASCFLGAIILFEDVVKSRFLLASGLLTGYLAIDDAFLFHEGVIPHFLHLTERYIYMGYLLVILVYFGIFLRLILTQTDYPILAFALIFFAISIIFDVFLGKFPTEIFEAFYEDSAKFFGIAFWFAYFFTTSIKLAKQKISRTIPA